jgi:hypothetical protein
MSAVWAERGVDEADQRSGGSADGDVGPGVEPVADGGRVWGAGVLRRGLRGGRVSGPGRRRAGVWGG